MTSKIFDILRTKWDSLSEADRVAFKLLVIIGSLALITVALMTWAPRSETPKGSEADIKIRDARIQKTEADVLSGKADAVNVAKVQAVKEAARRAARVREINRDLESLQSNYEKLSKAPVAISDADLDERERRLIADLKRLYPNQK